MSLSRGRNNDSEDVILSTDSPAIDESGSSGGNLGGGGGGGGGGGVVLKKGPWTSAEDAILVEYVKKHGEGNWNAVQKYSGLSRCGKSCRLRWANHLRPNLKKGAFTSEEERLIIELHAKMGNKWARMAAHLPGRTDNEIKNYWNTRIKRRQRAGLPLYPPELGVQAFQENQQYQNGNGLHGGDKGHMDPLQANGYDIADVLYNNLSTNQSFTPYIPPLPDFSAGSSLMKGLGSPIYSFTPPVRSYRKRLRESECHLSNYGGNTNQGPQFVTDQEDTSGSNTSQSFSLNLPRDHDAVAKKLLPFGANWGSQSLLNGHFSASKPIIGAVKLELPSLQYPETTLGSWVSNPTLPALESVDSFIQSSPLGPTQSDCPSPRSSGLLEAVLYEAEALSGSKNPSSEKSSNSSTVTPGDLTDSSPLTMGSPEYEGYGNPNSPFGNSSGCVFSNWSPINATRSSFEKNPSAGIFAGSNVKSEPIDPTWYADGEKNESSSQLNFLRPDALLGSCWLGQIVSSAQGQTIATDSIAATLEDDSSSDFKNTTSGTSALANSSDFDSCSWKNMPGAC